MNIEKFNSEGKQPGDKGQGSKAKGSLITKIRPVQTVLRTVSAPTGALSSLRTINVFHELSRAVGAEETTYSITKFRRPR